jgi:hypothetical protein
MNITALHTVVFFHAIHLLPYTASVWYINKQTQQIFDEIYRKTKNLISVKQWLAYLQIPDIQQE